MNLINDLGSRPGGYEIDPNMLPLAFRVILRRRPWWSRLIAWTLRTGLVVLLVTPASAANLCPGGLCGPGSTLFWNQPDGTTAATGWLVRISRAPDVCGAAAGVTTITITTAQLGLVPGIVGPLTVNVPFSMLGSLSNGVYYVNVAATGPTGTTACNGEMSFPFAGSPAQVPTGLGVR